MRSFSSHLPPMLSNIVSEPPPSATRYRDIDNFLVREAQLRIERGSGSEPNSQLKEKKIETPLTPPHDKRGSERLLKRAATEGRTTYNDMAGIGGRKRKKRNNGHGLKSMDRHSGASASCESGMSSDKTPQKIMSPRTRQTVRHYCFKSMIDEIRDS